MGPVLTITALITAAMCMGIAKLHPLSTIIKDIAHSTIHGLVQQWWMVEPLQDTSSQVFSLWFSLPSPVTSIDEDKPICHRQLLKIQCSNRMVPLSSSIPPTSSSQLIWISSQPIMLLINSLINSPINRTTSSHRTQSKTMRTLDNMGLQCIPSPTHNNKGPLLLKADFFIVCQFLHSL